MAKNRTGFLGLVDMAEVLLEAAAPGEPKSRRSRDRGDRDDGGEAGAITSPDDQARALRPHQRALASVSDPRAPQDRGAQGAQGPEPRVIEAIDSETGKTTWVVIHGAARAECSTAQMAEQIRSALVSR